MKVAPEQWRRPSWPRCTVRCSLVYSCTAGLSLNIDFHNSLSVVSSGPLRTQLLGWAGPGWAGLGWAGLGWAGLGWAAVTGWVTGRPQVRLTDRKTNGRLADKQTGNPANLETAVDRPPETENCVNNNPLTGLAVNNDWRRQGRTREGNFGFDSLVAKIEN